MRLSGHRCGLKPIPALSAQLEPWVVQWDGIATGGRCWPGLGAWQLHVVLTFAEQLPEFAVIFTAELNIQCFSE